jgi:hypothetical protein
VDQEKCAYFIEQDFNHSGKSLFTSCTQRKGTMFKRLKEKWNVDSDLQLIVIFVVFSISGSGALVIRKLVFHWLDYSPDWPFWLSAIVYVLTIVPAYQIMLMLFGTLLGQFTFFWNFEKKLLRRFGIKID